LVLYTSSFVNAAIFSDMQIDIVSVSSRIIIEIVISELVKSIEVMFYELALLAGGYQTFCLVRWSYTNPEVFFLK
jgi:hypothetical protein